MCNVTTLFTKLHWRSTQDNLEKPPLSSVEEWVLSLQITLFQYKDFYCGRIRVALSLPALLHSYQNKTWNCSGQEITVCTHWPRSGMVSVWGNSTSSSDNVEGISKIIWITGSVARKHVLKHKVLWGFVWDPKILGSIKSHHLLLLLLLWKVILLGPFQYLSISIFIFYVCSQLTNRPLFLFSNSLIN